MNKIQKLWMSKYLRRKYNLFSFKCAIVSFNSTCNRLNAFVCFWVRPIVCTGVYVLPHFVFKHTSRLSITYKYLPYGFDFIYQIKKINNTQPFNFANKRAMCLYFVQFFNYYGHFDICSYFTWALRQIFVDDQG